MPRRFLWAQKGPAMLHALTMSAVGARVVLSRPWAAADIWAGRDELATAFLGLELAFLMQARSLWLDRRPPCHPCSAPAPSACHSELSQRRALLVAVAHMQSAALAGHCKPVGHGVGSWEARRHDA
jgi:hypothetical protein